jgi:hypothetical protein
MQADDTTRRRMDEASPASATCLHAFKPETRQQSLKITIEKCTRARAEIGFQAIKPGHIAAALII